MRAPRKSAMTIGTYRVTGEGRRIDVSPREVVEADRPSYNPLTWPSCRCPRCRTEAPSGPAA
ncbi:hypothetical protein [Kitasatospora mediocidica]|uniref:hypothetical protein n=1 Tax=Kitasatospora mediocidica TaxID=58352 RepID=UPI0012F74334|nr:hypothetical protein [Kitasatospora mediocidica]